MKVNLTFKQNKVGLKDAITTGRLPLVVLALCLLAISFTGYFYYVQQTRHIEQAILEQLGSIGDLKSQQISDWIVERKADAEVLANSPAVVVDFLLHPGENRQSDEALDWLSAWLKHYHYRKIRLVDATGTMQLSMPERLESPPSALIDIAKEAMRTRKVMISSFYRAPNEQVNRISHSRSCYKAPTSPRPFGW